MSDLNKPPDEYWTEYAEDAEMVTCPSCRAINITRIHEVCWNCGRRLREE